MKKLLLALLLAFTLTSCAKEPLLMPDYITADVYKTKIKFANGNEPQYNYWYVFVYNQKYYYTVFSSEIENFKGKSFQATFNLPQDLVGVKPIKQVKILKEQLQ